MRTEIRLFCYSYRKDLLLLEMLDYLTRYLSRPWEGHAAVQVIHWQLPKSDG